MPVLYIYIYTLYSTRVQAEIFQSFEEEEVISDKKTLSVIWIRPELSEEDSQTEPHTMEEP